MDSRRPLDYFPHASHDIGPLFPGVSRDVYDAQQDLREVSHWMSDRAITICVQQALNNPDRVPETVSTELEQRLMSSRLAKQPLHADESPTADPDTQPDRPQTTEAPRPETPETTSETPPALQQPISPAEAMVAHRATEAAELKAKLSCAEARNATLASHTTRLQSQLQLLQAQVAELNAELASMASAREADALELACLREQLQDAMLARGANTSLLEAQLTLARAELAVAHEKAASMAGEQQALTQQLIEAKIEAATTTERLLSVEHEHSRASEEAPVQQRPGVRAALKAGGKSLKKVLLKGDDAS